MVTAPPISLERPTGAYGPSGRSAWLDVDWREHQRWVRVRGRWVNVVEMGTGAPLVFVHGLGGSWQNWLENIPHFAAFRRVVAFDLPGFGASEMPESPVSILEYADTVDALLTELGIPTADVVGNSMGGFIAAELAIGRPARVARLVLVDPAGLSARYRRLLPLAPSLEALTRWLAPRSNTLVRRPGLRRALLVMVAAHPERLPLALVQEQLAGQASDGFHDALLGVHSHDIRHRVPRIACPTLVVWGTEDRLVPVEDAAEWVRLVPDARAVVWEDTGHVPMLERPALFNSAVAEFLAR